MNVIPASNALSRMACEVFSSHCPPNVIVPRQRRETKRPVAPKRTLLIATSRIDPSRRHLGEDDPHIERRDMQLRGDGLGRGFEHRLDDIGGAPGGARDL